MENDFALLADARRMDQEALVAIFDRYATALYKYALRLYGDPLKADNAVGDVFTKFLEQLAHGKGPDTNLRSYLYRMTFNHIVDGTRLSRREAPLELVDFESNNGNNGYHSMASSLEDKMLLDTVISAIKNHLTANQRHVVILRFVEEFSLRETAEIVGKEVSSVKAIQNRAIVKLRKILDQTVSA